MKKQYLLIIIFIFLCGISYSKQLRINNNAEMDPDYTSLEDAIDNCSQGDTLYLEGSPTSYSGDTIDKKVTIIGTGYFISENPKTQAYSYETLINGNIIFHSMSDSSIITGCKINGYLYIGADHITVKRNNINNISNSNNIEYAKIIQNYVNNNIVNQSSLKISKSIISNNIIGRYVSFNTNGETNQIINNVIIGIYGPTYSISCYNSAVHNNISCDTIARIAENTGNAISHNILASSDTSISGNLYNVIMDSVFVDYDGTLDYSTDGKWMLKENSPAIEAGLGNTDCGAFDGIEPYVLSGIPEVPHIYEVKMPGTVISNEDLSVTIKVKSGD